MTADYRPWDDGAAKPVPLAVGAGQQLKVCDGPLVLLGWTIYNAGAGSVGITLFDGAGLLVDLGLVGAGTRLNRGYSDRGVKINTELQLQVGAGQAVTGVLYVRQKYDFPGDDK